MSNVMDRKDMEMMEAEDVTQPQQQDKEAVRDLLASARQLINQGKPSQALQAGKKWGRYYVLAKQVVMALRTQGGDNAVFQSLNRAREQYRNRLQQNTAVDQLAALFAECVIAEAQPLRPESSAPNMGDFSIAPDAHGTSILAETGRMQIVLDAFSDGSSFICLQCGGLVSNQRKDEHCAYWCSSG